MRTSDAAERKAASYFALPQARGRSALRGPRPSRRTPSRSPRREKRERGGGRVVGRELLIDDELEIGDGRQHERIPSPVGDAPESDEGNPLLGRDARHGGGLHVQDGGAAAFARSEGLEELEEEVRVGEWGRVTAHPRGRGGCATRLTSE